jgi:hypothetical protein
MFAKDDDGIDRDLLASIGSLLPRNPRQLKLFVRTLALLTPQWRRFDRDEISLSAAYLVQLLTLEFPHESRLLASRDQDIEWIEKYHIRQSSQRINASGGGSKTGAVTTEIPATASEIRDESRRTRYVELCSEIGKRLPLTADYRVRDMLALTHQPPLLTWKEFDGIAAEAKSGSVVSVLQRWIDGDDDVPTQERQRVLFRRSVEYRSRVWGAGAHMLLVAAAFSARAHHRSADRRARHSGVQALAARRRPPSRLRLGVRLPQRRARATPTRSCAC